MKYYLIKYLRYLLRPLPRFVFGLFVTISPMLIGAEVLHIKDFGPEFSFCILSGVGLKILFDSVTRV